MRVSTLLGVLIAAGMGGPDCAAVKWGSHSMSNAMDIAMRFMFRLLGSQMFRGPDMFILIRGRNAVETQPYQSLLERVLIEKIG
jgi:hypothetical protein